MLGPNHPNPNTGNWTQRERREREREREREKERKKERKDERDKSFDPTRNIAIDVEALETIRKIFHRCHLQSLS
jgi:hypothetical protein